MESLDDLSREHVFAMLDPSDILCPVSRDVGIVPLERSPSTLTTMARAVWGGGGPSSPASSCRYYYIPLACVCKAFRRTVSDPRVIAAAIERSDGSVVLRALRGCVRGAGGGSGPVHTALLRLAAARQRLIGASRDDEDTPSSLPLELQPVCASTTDHHFESIKMTAQPPIVRRSAMYRGEYWSCVAQDSDSNEFLIYRLPGLCSVRSVRVKGYREGPPGMCVTFSWCQQQLLLCTQLPGACGQQQRRRAQTGGGGSSGDGDDGCDDDDDDDDDDDVGCVWRTPVLDAYDDTGYQTLELPPGALGRYLVLRLLGKRYQQTPDTGWYVCVDHVDARGQLMLQGRCVAEPASSTEARPRWLLPTRSQVEAAVRAAQEAKSVGNEAFRVAVRARKTLESAGSASAPPLPEPERAAAEAVWLTSCCAAAAAYSAGLRRLRRAYVEGTLADGGRELWVALLSNRAECRLQQCEQVQRRVAAGLGAHMAAIADTHWSTTQIRGAGHDDEAACAITAALGVAGEKDADAALEQQKASSLSHAERRVGARRLSADRAFLVDGGAAACFAAQDACAALEILPSHDKSHRRLDRACRAITQEQARAVGGNETQVCSQEKLGQACPMAGCGAKAAVEADCVGAWAMRGVLLGGVSCNVTRALGI
jgi:hypothetical protein